MTKKLKQEIFSIAKKRGIKLSEDNFEEEFQERVDWCSLSCIEKLSEEFIDYFKNYVDWYWISEKQYLSEE